MLGGHMQWNPLTLSTQVPPLIHGFEWHSLISVSHLTPSGEQFRGSERHEGHPVCYRDDCRAGFLFSFLKHTCISWGAHAFVLVNAVLALAVLTGVARTVIFIDLTVHPWRTTQWKTHKSN